MIRRSLMVCAALAAATPLALAGDVLGEWARDDGKGKVRFSPCGGAVCGAIRSEPVSHPLGPLVGSQPWLASQ